MKRWLLFMGLFLGLLGLDSASVWAQDDNLGEVAIEGVAPIRPVMYYRGKVFYKGDSIDWFEFQALPVFKPLKFKNKREVLRYNRLVHNVKKVLPLAKLVKATMMETYDYLETLPTKREKDAHIAAVEKGVKQQYTPVMKKLTFSQGKLLIKLIDRECNQSSYELVKAFMGSFKAGFYQVFASLFGASLKKEYDAEGDDRLIERVVLLVESGAL